MFTYGGSYGSVLAEENYEETRVEWKLPNFSIIAEDKTIGYCQSPLFPFEGESWYFQLWPVSCFNPECMALYILSASVSPRKYTVEYNFGLKRMDNSLEHLVRENVVQNGILSKSYFLKRAEILRRKCELTPSDVLTVTCTLKPGTCLCCKRKVVPNPKKRIKLETLSENFKNLFHNKESCDVTLHVMDKEYKAHKSVLIARSTVFAAMFQHTTSEKQTDIVTISDCDSETFVNFLEFVYCGKLEQLSPSNAFHLYKTSEKYNVQGLKISCSEYLMENLTVENFSEVAVTADKYNDTKLLSVVQRFFNYNLTEVLMTSEWECLLDNYRRLANELLVEMSRKMKAVD